MLVSNVIDQEFDTLVESKQTDGRQFHQYQQNDRITCILYY